MSSTRDPSAQKSKSNVDEGIGDTVEGDESLEEGAGMDGPSVAPSLNVQEEIVTSVAAARRNNLLIRG